MSMKMFDIGKVIGTHGIKGEVKVERLTDFKDRFHVGEHVYLVLADEIDTLTIKTHRKHKQWDLLSFEGYEHINDVEKMKNAYLKIDESQLTPLAENEYYYYEIIDCDVYTMANVYIGKITEILSPGANDVFVVKQTDGKEVLIPNIQDVVKNIDIRSKKVLIHPIEGLLD